MGHSWPTSFLPHLKLQGTSRHATARAPLDPVLQLVAHLGQCLFTGRGGYLHRAERRTGVANKPGAVLACRDPQAVRMKPLMVPTNLLANHREAASIVP